MIFLTFGVVFFVVCLAVSWRKPFFALANGLLIGVLSYIFCPTLAWNYYAVWIISAIGMILPVISCVDFIKEKIDKYGRIQVKGEKKIHYLRISFPLGTGIGALLCLGIIYIFTSSPMFHAEQKRDMIGLIKNQTFDAIKLFNPSQFEMVDEDIARSRGQELLGSMTGFGNLKIGKFTKQKIDGKTNWIAPLEHDNIYHWFSYRSVPGYIRISAYDAHDAEVVTSYKDNELAFVYTEGAWFGKNLHRYIYTHGYKNIGFTDFTFVVDDKGYPYWMTTIYQKKIGFDGEDAIGVLLVDPQTGNINEYNNANAPEWIKFIYPKDFIKTQLNDWGKYVLGWPNLEDTDKVKLSSSLTHDLSNWYSGVQSMKLQGITGFVFVDGRTKETSFIKLVGASEDEAKAAIQGKVQNYKWTSTVPTLNNVDGIPTYISLLKDDAGNFKGIGIVNVENRAVVEYGIDLIDAMRKYQISIRGDKTNTVVAKSPPYQISGKITRIGTEIVGDTTYYYFMLDTVPNKIFVGNLKINVAMVVSHIGDQVTITADETKDAQINIVSFANSAVVLEKTSPIGKRLDLISK